MIIIDLFQINHKRLIKHYYFSNKLIWIKVAILVYIYNIMKSSIYLLQFCFISIILFSCKKSYHPHLSFYHWSISETGESYHAKHNDSVLYQFQSKKLYIKIMDIDWDENYGVYPSTHYFLDDYLYYSNHKLSYVSNL